MVAGRLFFYYAVIPGGRISFFSFLYSFVSGYVYFIKLTTLIDPEIDRVAAIDRFDPIDSIF